MSIEQGRVSIEPGRAERAQRASQFWRFWAAGTASGVGSAVTTVALPLIAVTTLHASAWQVSVITAASYAAWVVIGLPAGVIVARLPLRPTQVAMDLIRAAAIGSIPVAWWLGHLTLAQLALVALVVSLATVVFDVGNSTFLASVVDPSELTARNSLISATQSATSTGGPSLGGLLVQLVGAVPTLCIDTVSYVVSAALLKGLPRGETRSAEAGPGMITLIREGWQFVVRHPVMRPCVLVATSVNFVCGALLALTPIYLVRDLSASPGLVGVLIATDGVGSLIGATLNPRFAARWGTAQAILLAEAGGALFALLIPAGHGVWALGLFAVGNAGFATGVVITSINTRTHRQVASPPELLSRVMATVRFVSWGVIPVGALVAGALATWTSPRTALWVFCAVNLVSPLILWTSAIRHRRDLVEAA